MLPQGPLKEIVNYETRPGYKSRNRGSCSRFLKVSRDGAEVTSTGRSFHVQAPATRKAQHPIVGSLTAGMSRSLDEEDRSLSRVFQTRPTIQHRHTQHGRIIPSMYYVPFCGQRTLVLDKRRRRLCLCWYRTPDLSQTVKYQCP